MKNIKFLVQWLPKKYLMYVIVGMLLTALDGVIIPAFTGNLIQVASGGDFSQLIVVTLLGILGYSFVRLGVYIWEESQQRMVRIFIRKIKANILQSYFYGNVSKAEVETLLLNELQMIEQQGIVSILNFCYCIAFSLITLVYVCILNLQLSLLFIVFSLLPLGVPKLFSNHIKDSSTNWSQSNQEYVARQQEYLSSKKTIVNFRVQNHFLKRLIENIINTEQKYYTMNHFLFLSKLSSNLVSGVSSFVPLAVGIYFVMNQKVELSVLMAVYLASDRIVSPLLNAIDYSQKFIATVPLIEKLKHYLVLPSIDDTESSESLLPIQLSSCHLQMGEKYIFKDLSLNIVSGDRILLMGKSGTGKSTLLELLFGNIPYSDGQLTYNQIASQQISQNHKRQRIGYFTQEMQFFTDTLWFNITLGESFSENEVLSVLDKVALSYLVESYGLYAENTGIKERLSGGEKARLALARLLLRNYDLLLIDEFSSAVDEKTTMQIRSILVREQLTFIEISHRYPENINIYTKGYQLENGVLTELQGFDENTTNVRSVI